MNNKYTTFDDYVVGQRGVTGKRTVGEAEIVAFASITCDYNFLHVATHEAEKTFYGGRIAHGLLGCSMAVGLLSLDAPHAIGRTVAESYFSGFTINYRSALKSGDTVRVEWEIARKDASRGPEGCGVIETAFRVVNHNDQPIYDGVFQVTVKTSAAAHGILLYETSMVPVWSPSAVSCDEDSIFSIGDFAVGAGGVTCGRTITEADVVNFAGLTGDYSPIYVDEIFASKSAFGGRIVPAMFVFDLALGFWSRDSWITKVKTDTTAQDIGHLGDNARFLRPVKIGDTVRCVYKVKDSRPTKSNPNRHVVVYGFQILNQRDEVVQDGEVLVIKGDAGR